MPRYSQSVSRRVLVLTFVVTAVVTVAVTLLLVNIFERKHENRQYPYKVVTIPEGEIDPSVWGKNHPYEYNSFVKTEIDYGRTEYGGSEAYSRLERYPAMVRLWAGYSFSVDHNEERGHHYAAEDQANTERVKIVDQPGACINCHAAEAPQLIEELGWEVFNSTPYNELKNRLAIGSSFRPGAIGSGTRKRVPAGNAHLRVRPVPCGVLLPRREQGADVSVEQGQDDRCD
jgi:nitrite reductase (cytochrome c-552)